MPRYRIAFLSEIEVDLNEGDEDPWTHAAFYTDDTGLSLYSVEEIPDGS